MLPDYAMPLQGFLGGLMIGAAAALMLLTAGRIAGVSGMAARALGLGGSAPRSLAIVFIVGLPLGAALISVLAGPVLARFPMSPLLLIAAGLIVGIGTRLGSGCTSGHGVCGMSRLSKRSVVATIVFMTTGFVTVALVNAAGGAW